MCERESWDRKSEIGKDSEKGEGVCACTISYYSAPTTILEARKCIYISVT